MLYVICWMLDVLRWMLDYEMLDVDDHDENDDVSLKQESLCK